MCHSHDQLQEHFRQSNPPTTIFIFFDHHHSFDDFLSPLPSLFAHKHKHKHKHKPHFEREGEMKLSAHGVQTGFSLEIGGDVSRSFAGFLGLEIGLNFFKSASPILKFNPQIWFSKNEICTEQV